MSHSSSKMKKKKKENLIANLKEFPMYFYSSKTTFETLPDEMILEICRYLHCSHVLYSFFDLNSRLNQTITSYYRHVWFRRATYRQLLHIYDYILPRIGSSIITLTIHPLHQSSFPILLKQQIGNIIPYLKNLTLTSWRSENLLLNMFESLQQMNYLEKLVIQELSSSSTIEDQDFLKKILTIKTNFLTKIIFDYDCDTFNLNNSPRNYFLSDHIRYLTIQLDTLQDLSILIHFIPNIYQLDVTIKNSSLESPPFQTQLEFLKQFSIWTIHWYSHFNDLISLLSIAPSIEQFSLTISTRDVDLINGEKLLSILPSQLKQFHYTVCCYIYDNYEQFHIDQMKKSWQSIPIVYSFSEYDKRIFLHTLPYSSSRLIIRSSLAKCMSTKDIHQMYSKIEHIQVYTMTNLEDIFPILAQCRRVRELTLLTANELIISHSQTTSSGQQSVKLPFLYRLDILTIEGIPSDLHHMKELLIAAPNLSVLVIDLDCLLALLEDENESLIVYVLLHRHILDLCIRIEGNNSNNEQTKTAQITVEQIHLIARIFTRVRNLTIDYESSEELIQSNIITSVINEFKDLVIFHIYGKLPYDMIDNDIRLWIIEQNPFRIKSTDIFRVECNNGWFKLWL